MEKLSIINEILPGRECVIFINYIGREEIVIWTRMPLTQNSSCRLILKSVALNLIYSFIF